MKQEDQMTDKQLNDFAEAWASYRRDTPLEDKELMFLIAELGPVVRTVGRMGPVYSLFYASLYSELRNLKSYAKERGLKGELP